MIVNRSQPHFVKLALQAKVILSLDTQLENNTHNGDILRYIHINISFSFSLMNEPR